MKARLALALLLAPAAPASAQMTTCSSTTNYVNCYTFPPAPSMQPPPPSYTPAPTYTAPDMSGFVSLFARLHERSERKKEEKRIAKEAAVNDPLRPHIIEMIRAGDCHGALDYAVSHGTLSFAGEVADYCQRAAPAN